MKKLHRLMAPREDGSFLVPAHFVKLWRDTVDGGRDEVKKLWLNAGGDKELLNMGNQHCFLFNNKSSSV